MSYIAEKISTYKNTKNLIKAKKDTKYNNPLSLVLNGILSGFYKYFFDLTPQWAILAILKTLAIPC